RVHMSFTGVPIALEMRAASTSAIGKDRLPKLEPARIWCTMTLVGLLKPSAWATADLTVPGDWVPVQTSALFDRTSTTASNTSIGEWLTKLNWKTPSTYWPAAMAGGGSWGASAASAVRTSKSDTPVIGPGAQTPFFSRASLAFRAWWKVFALMATPVGIVVTATTPSIIRIPEVSTVGGALIVGGLATTVGSALGCTSIVNCIFPVTMSRMPS